MHKICRIITDDKIGNINPAMALAEVISRELSLEINHIIIKNNRFLRLLPACIIKLLSSYFLIEKIFNISNNPNVVITIGNGGASIVPCLALSSLERKFKKNGLFVQLQNPRINSHYFDYVIAPMHDEVRNGNVIPIIGSLSRVKHILETSDFKIPDKFLHLPKPIIAVFIGGSNSRYRFSEHDAITLADYLNAYSKNNHVSLAITCSRRTGKKNEIILRKHLIGDNIFFPIDTDDNPYYMLLKYCDAAIITSDSVNMISDAVTAGLPSFLYELKGNQGKFLHFYTSLKQRNMVFDASDTYKKTTIDDFDETHRAARIIIAALIKRKENI